jgi:hypothetical protein
MRMSSRPPGVERRLVVSVEDHLYHTAEMLDAMARVAPDLLGWTTVCTVDSPGPDTSAAVADWLRRFPRVQIAGAVDVGDFPDGDRQRLRPIDPGDLAEPLAFARTIASLLLPDGVLVQDVHLSTLRFVPADRWWESIYVAATVRGLFAERRPTVRFISNKRGYTATFGRDLMEAGFDPRDVMDKSELETVIVPSLVRDLEARLPLELVSSDDPSPLPMAAHESSRHELERRFDLVEWDVSGRVELGGRLLAAPVTFRAASNEGATWQRLIAERLDDGAGVPVLEVGQRLADADAERAELSNLAARHVHALRSRLSNPSAIVTVNHAYRLDAGVVVGRVRRRAGSYLRQPPVSPAPQTNRAE